MSVSTTMKGLIIGAGVVALVYAAFKDGPGNLFVDAIIIIILCAGTYALYHGYQQHQRNSEETEVVPLKEVDQLKFLNAYDKIKDAVMKLQFVRQYNQGDFLRLTQQVDDFVKKYQYLYNNSGIANGQAEQHIDLLLDMRTNLLETMQSFFVSVPADKDESIQKQYMKLQSITYHMIKKVQQTTGVRRMWFPRPRCSMSHFSRRASSWMA